MRTLWTDIRFGLRVFRRNPFTTAAIVLTLGLGIGANAAVFSLVNGAFLKPFPHGDGGRLLRLYEYNLSRDFRMSFSYPNFHDYRSRTRTVERMAAYRSAGFTLSLGERPWQVSGAWVSAGLFEIFETDAILGRVFSPEDEQPGAEKVAILNEDLWRSNFSGDTGIVGKSVRIDGEPHTIVGVVGSTFKFPIDSLVWKPLALDPGEKRGHRSLAVVALPKASVGAKEVDAELEVIARRLADEYPGVNFDVGIRTRSFRDAYVDDARTPLLVVQVAVFFVLLITCANASSLVLAQGAARGREAAIRTALGSGRRRLLQQFLTEGVLLALLGGVVGILLTRFLVVALVTAVPDGVPYWIDFGIDVRVLLFTLGVSLVCAPAFSLLPALRSSRLDVNEILKEVGRGNPGSRSQQLFFRIIVVAEMAVTIVLLLGAGLLVKSFRQLQEVDPGFEEEGALTFHLSGPPAATYPETSQVVRFYDRLLASIRADSRVEAAGANARLPLKGDGTETWFIAEGAARQPPLANLQVVTPGYFEALEVPLVQGRFFEERDNREEAAPVAIVNEEAVRKMWPDGDVLGKRVKTGQHADWMEVVGVVGDVRHRALDGDYMMDLYRVHRQSPERGMTVVVRTSRGDPMSLGPELRQKVQEIDPDVVVADLMAMDEVISESLWLQRFGASVLFAFGIAATFLAVLGIYAVVSYSVTQRTQEIGVRMSFGATGQEILQLVMRGSLRLVLVGIAVGLPFAAVVNVLLSSQLYGIGKLEVVLMLAVVALLVAVAVAASLLPAIRSARNSPALSLRYE